MWRSILQVVKFCCLNKFNFNPVYFPNPLADTFFCYISFLKQTIFKMSCWVFMGFHPSAAAQHRKQRQLVTHSQESLFLRLFIWGEFCMFALLPVRLPGLHRLLYWTPCFRAGCCCLAVRLHGSKKIKRNGKFILNPILDTIWCFYIQLDLFCAMMLSCAS